jgi:flagellar biosynthesis anti-sigma factor FlgM
VILICCALNPQPNWGGLFGEAFINERADPPGRVLAMKVHEYINAKIGNTYLNQSRATKRGDGERGDRAVSKSKRVGKDEIVLSSHATEARKFEELAGTMSDARPEKIEAVKGQIELGTYDVEGKLVAKGIADILKSI